MAAGAGSENAALRPGIIEPEGDEGERVETEGAVAVGNGGTTIFETEDVRRSLPLDVSGFSATVFRVG